MVQCEKCGVTSDQAYIVDRWNVVDVSIWPKDYTNLCKICFNKILENE